LSPRAPPFCRPEPSPFLSPRAPPFCRPERHLLSPRAPFFVAPSASFCRPEPPFLSPRALSFFVAPSPLLFCRPEHLLFVTPNASFCHPEPSFVAPNGARGPLFSLSLPQGGDFSLRSKRQGRGVAPNAPLCRPEPSPFLSPRAPPFVTPSLLLFCHPERSEGSLGAYAPREDIPMSRPELSEGGRRPERSEGCLATACYLPAHENQIHPCKYLVLFYIKSL